MIKRTIANDSALMQQHFPRLENKEMLRQAFDFFLNNVIRENCTHHNDRYTLFADELPYQDKKLFLSYIADPIDYEYYITNPTREKAAIEEYLPEMQHLIDERIDDIYHADMREMGLTQCQHNDNGEFYYYKR